MPGFGQPEMRRFGDHEATKNNIYNGAMSAVQSIPPIENQRYSLSIQDPGWSGTGDFSLADHKNALLTGRTLGRRLSGTFTLTDKATNSVIDSRRMTVASVPALTKQGSFVLDGSNYVLAHQLRLLPGVYSRRKSNGELEAHVNHLPGRGVPHRINLDPETGVFKIHVGQAEIPAVSLMRAMGVTPEELEARWGKELTAVNLKAEKPHHLGKLFERMGPAGPVPELDHEKAQALAAKVSASELDPWVSKRTLGHPHKFYDKHAMLAATGKLLDIARGKAEPDDRDNPAYAMVWGPEHLIAERLERSKPLLSKILWQATNAGSLKRIQPGPLTPAVRAAFLKSGLGLLPEGTSAAEHVDHGARITKVGEGGIGKSAESVPMSARNISAGQFPFIDPVRTSECFDPETEVLTAVGWKKWPDVTSEDEFACDIDDWVEFHQAKALHVSDYCGPMYGYRGDLLDYLVTPDHRFCFTTMDDDGALNTAWWTAQHVHENDGWHKASGLRGTKEYGDTPRSLPQIFKFAAETFVPAKNDGSYYITPYSGKVYCATVPGSKLYVRRGSCAGFWSGNSESVGVDLRVAFGTKLGKDKRIYAPVRDARTGKIVYRSPQDLADRTTAFPNAHLEASATIPAIRGGKLTYVPRHEVDYHVPSMEQSFSPLTNMVPIKSASKPHRASMGGRMITQSLPVVDAEAPFVRSQVPGQPGKSFEELFGRHMGAVFAHDKQPGVVEKVTPDGITVRYADNTTQTHELFNNHPSGRKSGVSATPLVQPGQTVSPGQLLAKSNYTDDKGHAAYGLNARIAFMQHPGVYEDSIAVSRSFADRMKSDHLYKHEILNDEHTTIGKQAHAAAFPGKHPLELLKAFSDDGVVKPGTVVNKDDPLILAVRKRPGEFGKLSRSGRAGITDASEVWHYDEPGVVTDAVKGPHGPIVVVKSQKSLQSGDKLAGRHGNKGIAVVFPDHEMPHGSDGKPIDVILSSLGTISRGNPSAIYEAALGKIASKTGQPYVFDDFKHGNDVGRYVQGELAQHGVDLKEDLTDPKTGRSIPGVSVGSLYIMKLSHIAENKAKGRGLGATDESGQPTRGQNNGAMRMSLGDTNAMLSAGATSVIHDAHSYRGQSNPEFWLSYMAGFPTPKPTVSEPFQRWLTELRASGVDPVHKDSRYHLMALTNKRVKELAGDREVKNGETLDFSKNGEPYAGGLFDPRTFGAVDSKSQWAHIPLHEPMLNPVMEEPTRRLLGLTEEKFRDVIAHKHNIATGTGPKAIADALGKIDVDKELKKTEELAHSSRKTARDDANRKLVYLRGLKKTGQNPTDWVLDSVPVLPPAFRPVTNGPGGVVVSDANLLYKDLFDANDALRHLSKETADTGAEKLNLYDSVKAVMGLGDPVGAKNRERGAKGVLQRLLGDTAKLGFYQQKILGSPTNLSGRAQALPNPDLDMDEVGIPEAIAWNVYHPFVVRRMVRQGIPKVEAAQMTSEQHPKAKKALLDEMTDRPILMTRYPALHRHSVMAFNPRLVAGSGVHVNNLVTKPYGGDFDGDAYTLNVPLSDEAVKEAREKLFPSKNLFSPANMKATTYLPNMEYVNGLHNASTRDDKNDVVEFHSLAEARAAHARGEIGMSTRIRILNDQKST